MDTAAAVLIAKGAMVLFGVVVILRVLVREYQRLADSMAGEIARAALERRRKAHAADTAEPRVTLSPASDADQPSTT